MKILKLLPIVHIVFLLLYPAIAQDSAPTTPNPACIPTPRQEDWATAQHNTILHLKTSDPQILFIGDAVIHSFAYIRSPLGGLDVWNEQFAGLKSAAFSVPGDKTQNVLWRIGAGGELSGINPKAIVLLIGRNNLLSSEDTPAQTAAGIEAIVQQIEEKLPQAKILLLGIFPGGIRGAKETNEIIGKLEDLHHIYYLNLGEQVSQKEDNASGKGNEDKSPLEETDYRIFGAILKPYLEDMIINNGQGALWNDRVNGKPKASGL